MFIRSVTLSTDFVLWSWLRYIQDEVRVGLAESPSRLASPRFLHSSRSISPLVIRQSRYCLLMTLHGVDSLEFLRKQAMYSIICSLHSPSWSKGKEPRSGGEVLNPTLIDGGRPKDMGVRTLAAGYLTRNIMNERSSHFVFERTLKNVSTILIGLINVKYYRYLWSRSWPYKVPTKVQTCYKVLAAAKSRLLC